LNRGKGKAIQPKPVAILAVLLFFVIAVLPVGLMVADSLVSGGRLPLEQYGNLFADARQIGLFIRSLTIVAGAACLSLALGLPLAFLLARTDIAGKHVWQWLYLVPLCIPAYIHAITWIYLLGTKGVLTRWVMGIFGLQTPLWTVYGVAGSIATLAFSYYPFVVLMTLCGLSNMDRRLEDAARLNHTNFQVLRKVTLPLVFPYIFSGAVFVFIFALFNYGVPALLRVQTYPIEIFAQFSAFYNEAGAVVRSLPLVIVALILVTIQRYVMGSRAYVTLDTGRRQPCPMALGRFGKPALLYVGLVMLITVFLPVVVLIVQTGSFKSIAAALRTSSAAVITSTALSLAAATVTVILAYFMADLIESRRFKGRTALDYLTFVPFAFPATLLGIGLIYLWNRPYSEAVYTGSLILVIAYTARFVPFAVRALSSSSKQIAGSLKDAAWLCEKRWWKRAVKIDLPLAREGIAAGWIIAFVLCMSELGATLLVVPPGRGTLALKIYTLMHYGANKIVAALALILLAINLAVAAAAVLFFRRQRRSGLQYFTD
jgi:iron(III) transport system permease protein